MAIPNQWCRKRNNVRVILLSGQDFNNVSDRRNAFVTVLSNEGIKHAVLQNDQGGLTISWDHDDGDKTLRVVNKLMYEDE